MMLLLEKLVHITVRWDGMGRGVSEAYDLRRMALR